MKKLVLAAMAAAILPASAQDAPLKVLYQPAKGRSGYLVDKVMDLVLSRETFIKAAKADAQTLVVTVPEKTDRVSGSDNVPFSFTLGFARNGDAIGEASEDCTTGRMAACADQVASDLASASAIHR